MLTKSEVKESPIVIVEKKILSITAVGRNKNVFVTIQF